MEREKTVNEKGSQINERYKKKDRDRKAVRDRELEIDTKRKQGYLSFRSFSADDPKTPK